MTEEFWQEEKKKVAGNPFNENLIWKTTMKDVKDHASDKHPKALYAECLKNTQFWHHYAASPKISVDDLAMMVCRDLGCEINYCSLIKKSYVTEWEGSSDCMTEIKAFNDCMSMERRRFSWQEQKLPMYDYIQNRIAERRKESKFLNILTLEEQDAIRKLNEQQLEEIKQEKQVEMEMK